MISNTPSQQTRLAVCGKGRSHPLVMMFATLALAGAHAIGHAEAVPDFELSAKDGRLLPEVLEVPAGVKFRLVLRNEGKTPVEIENLELRVEKILAPNSAAKVTVQALKPGSYEFVDEFHAETGKMRLIAK